MQAVAVLQCRESVTERRLGSCSEADHVGEGRWQGSRPGGTQSVSEGPHRSSQQNGTRLHAGRKSNPAGQLSHLEACNCFLHYVKISDESPWELFAAALPHQQTSFTPKKFESLQLSWMRVEEWNCSKCMHAHWSLQLLQQQQFVWLCIIELFRTQACH